MSVYQHALSTGATIVVLTAGGKVKELAEQNGNLLFQLPSGRVPRIISTSHVLIPLLVILHWLGMISDPPGNHCLAGTIVSPLCASNTDG